jgi:hypothetical protein
VSDELAELAYAAALRALDKQEEVLSEIRSRTGVLLAASSLAVSFLGRSAIDQGNPVVVSLAIAAFAVSVGTSLYVLLPKKNLVFTLSGPALFEGLYVFRDDRWEIYRRLAYDLHRFWEDNDIILSSTFRLVPPRRDCSCDRSGPARRRCQR